MPDLILHHYDVSPFSEKVRLLFGLKKLAWKSVIQPVIMPKPDLIPLTGGYRRIPVMQIGADVFCDSQVILAEIERRHPEPKALLGAELRDQSVGGPVVLSNDHSGAVRPDAAGSARSGVHRRPHEALRPTVQSTTR